MAVCAGVAATPPARACCVTINQNGSWTLARLGFEARDLSFRAGQTRITLPYQLPRGAKQGPHTWYVLRLRFEIIFAEGRRAGRVWISGVTNHYAGVLVEFSRGAGQRSVTWNSFDLLRGWNEGTATSHRTVLDSRNYLPYRGVRPGRNTFTVTVRRAGALRVKRLRVFADSGIEVSRRSPARLALEPVLPRGPIRAGQTFEVGYRLANRGDRPARGVVIGVSAQQAGGPRIIGPRTQRLGSVEGRTSGTFRLTARQGGRYRLLLAADSHASHRRRVIEVVIASAPGPSKGIPTLARVVLAGVLVGTGTVLVVQGRQRRHIR